MALFLDSANLDDIRTNLELGLYAGVTTNPGLVAAIPRKQRLEHYGAIAKACRKSLFLQVDFRSIREMERQALTLVEVAPGRTIIKVPMSAEGLRLCQTLSVHQVPVCMTALFTPAQAIAAALAGAHSVALYVGRINRRGEDGIGAVRQAAAMFQANRVQTSVLAASIPDITTLCTVLAIPGVDATIPVSLQEALLEHPGTREAIEQFGKPNPPSPPSLKGRGE